MIRAALASLALSLALGAAPTLADAPRTSLRPVARAASAPLPAQAQKPAPAAQQIASNDRPGARKPGQGLFKSLRPQRRTEATKKQARTVIRQRQKGAVCGDLALQGEVVGRVPGRIKGCGIENAIKLRSVSGIALSQPALMDCTTAKSFKSWVERGLKPAIGKRGGGVAGLGIAAHYACRTRNNQPGAKLSEHSKGRAIDISSILLRDGSQITLLKHWNSKSFGKPLRQMHSAACGPFGTVLGPNANRYHLDHFHFDTARYRSGSYCR
ncbi:extensin family protein [Roseovarius sp. C7]|uniref:extensin-like domain-containing protein n=1 Tax=Roseovarius sp. C7 TaxID=3398643 RepID=UPI0039F6C8B2